MKVGVLGLGSIGKRHCENLGALGHEVHRYDPAQLPESYREETIKWADAVVIATPSDQHVSDMIDCEVAKKPFFVEKPISLKKSHMLGKVKPLMVGYNLRFHQTVMQARRILVSGQLGAPQWASITVAQFSDKPPYLRDGVILNWSHEIDLALYLLGRAKVLTASAETLDGNDFMADIILKHDNGCRSNIHLDYLTDPEIRATTIVCEKGQITIDLKNRWGCIVWKDGRPREEHQFTDSWDENYKEEMRAFVALAEGRQLVEYQHCTAQEGLAALDICLQARKKAGLK